MSVWKRRMAFGMGILLAATIAGAMLASPDPVEAPDPAPRSYLPCSDERGSETTTQQTLDWQVRCIKIPHLGPSPDWDCAGRPEDFDGPRWCPPWAEHHEARWTVTFLEQSVLQCQVAPSLAGALTDPSLGVARGCVQLNATMVWHPGNEACAGLKDSFPDVPGGPYRERFPALFCFSVDYSGRAWSSDSAGNATFTTSLSAERGSLGHIDAEHETTQCTWQDPGPVAGDEAGCDVATAAAAQGRLWVPHIAPHIFAPGTGGDHEVFVRLEVTAPGREGLVLEERALAAFFILGAG